MGNSLQDQFLKVGLVDKKKHAQAKKEKHVQKKSSAPDRKDEIASMAKQALAQKKERDKQLNKKKIAQRQAKENTAKARQLIETHKIQMERRSRNFISLKAWWTAWSREGTASSNSPAIISSFQQISFTRYGNSTPI